MSALDVSVQATIVNLLTTLKETLDVSMIFVSHNMAVVRQVGDRTAVMYLGRIVERAPRTPYSANPVHPDTRLLPRSVPRFGSPPAPVDPVRRARSRRSTAPPRAAVRPPSTCARPSPG